VVEDVDVVADVAVEMRKMLHLMLPLTQVPCLIPRLEVEEVVDQVVKNEELEGNIRELDRIGRLAKGEMLIVSLLKIQPSPL